MCSGWCNNQLDNNARCNNENTWSLSFLFPHQNSVRISLLSPQVANIPVIHPPSFHHRNTISAGIQINKLLFMQFCFQSPGISSICYRRSERVVLDTSSSYQFTVSTGKIILCLPPLPFFLGSNVFLSTTFSKATPYNTPLIVEIISHPRKQNVKQY